MKRIAITYSPLLTRIIFLSVLGIVLSLLLYGVFLLEAVAHTAARAQTQKEMSLLTRELAQSERDYLTRTRMLTEAQAYALGFTEPVVVSTVYDAHTALSLRGGEVAPLAN